MRLSRVLIAVFAVAICSAAAHADSITFTDTGTASGSLDGTSFGSNLVTLTLTGDTSAITSPSSGILLLAGTATVSVAGVGSDTFTDSITIDCSAGPEACGFLDGGSSIMLTFNPVLSTYGLTTAIGPLTGSNSYNPGLSFNTLSGTFVINSLPGDTTFTAVDNTTSAPEPNSLSMLGTGLLGLMGMALLRKRAGGSILSR